MLLVLVYHTLLSPSLLLVLSAHDNFFHVPILNEQETSSSLNSKEKQGKGGRIKSYMDAARQRHSRACSAHARKCLGARQLKPQRCIRSGSEPGPYVLSFNTSLALLILAPALWKGIFQGSYLQ